jgi:hypothetical protein
MAVAELVVSVAALPVATRHRLVGQGTQSQITNDFGKERVRW